MQQQLMNSRKPGRFYIHTCIKKKGFETGQWECDKKLNHKKHEHENKICPSGKTCASSLSYDSRNADSFLCKIG